MKKGLGSVVQFLRIICLEECLGFLRISHYMDNSKRLRFRWELLEISHDVKWYDILRKLWNFHYGVRKLDRGTRRLPLAQRLWASSWSTIRRYDPDTHKPGSLAHADISSKKWPSVSQENESKHETEVGLFLLKCIVIFLYQLKAFNKSRSERGLQSNWIRRSGLRTSPERIFGPDLAPAQAVSEPQLVTIRMKLHWRAVD